MADSLEDLEVGIGHNSTAGKQLTAFVERIERLEEEKKTVAEDIKEVYGEVKATGFDVKTVRKVIRLRAQDKAKREEEAALLETYLHALGML